MVQRPSRSRRAACVPSTMLMACRPPRTAVFSSAFSHGRRASITVASTILPRNCHTWRCTEALNRRKFFCEKEFC